MFEEMNVLIKQEAVRGLMHAEVEVEQTPQFEQQPERRQLSYQHDEAATLEALAAGYTPERGRRRAVHTPDRRAAPARPRARPSAATIPAGAGRARSTSGAMALDVGPEPRSLEDLRIAVEEIRAQLHWVRDYL